MRKPASQDPDRVRKRDRDVRPARVPRPRDRFGRPLPRDAEDEMPDAREPEEVVTTVEDALAHAAMLFDSQRFFEAHEFLEFIWKHEDVLPEDKDFWKGVTQVAVGCCHTQRGNPVGALTLLERAAGYIDPYPDRYRGVDASRLAAAARAVAARVRSEGPSPDVAFPRFPLAASQSAE